MLTVCRTFIPKLVRAESVSTTALRASDSGDRSNAMISESTIESTILVLISSNRRLANDHDRELVRTVSGKSQKHRNHHVA
jgi:hypothetical protein